MSRMGWQQFCLGGISLLEEAGKKGGRKVKQNDRLYFLRVKIPCT